MYLSIDLFFWSLLFILSLSLYLCIYSISTTHPSIRHRYANLSLSYSNKASEETREIIDMRNVESVSLDPKLARVFTITTTNRTFFMRATSEEVKGEISLDV